MATGMSSALAARMLEQYRVADPGERTRLKLHTAPPAPELFQPSGFTAISWAPPGRAGKPASGDLAALTPQQLADLQKRLSDEVTRRLGVK